MTITSYTVAANGGWKAAITIKDDSSIPFIGKPIVRRKVFGTVWIDKDVAQQCADSAASDVRETGVWP